MSVEFLDLEAIQRYATRRLADLARCRESLGKRDFETIQTIGHNLKGNGTSFGFPELSLLGEKMEISARERNEFQTAKLVDHFEQWIHQHKPST